MVWENLPVAEQQAWDRAAQTPAAIVLAWLAERQRCIWCRFKPTTGTLSVVNAERIAPLYDLLTPEFAIIIEAVG